MEHFSALNKIPNARLVRLTPDYVFKPFDCCNKDLNDFLTQDAKGYLKYLLAVTYVIETPNETIAYYSLANDMLKISVSSNRHFKKHLRKSIKDSWLYKIFDHEEFPSVKLGRLAVNKKYQHKGIGTEILNAITYSLINNNKTGCLFLTVDAINEKKVVDFYKTKNGFEFLRDSDVNKSSRVMYKILL